MANILLDCLFHANVDAYALLVRNFDHNGSDIVCDAVCECGCDQQLRRRHAVWCPQKRCYLLVGQGFTQAIAAQQKAITRFGCANHLVEFQIVRVGADGAGDDIGVRMMLRIFRRQIAGIDQFLDKGMITADLCKRAMAEQIGAAITGP